MIKTLALGLLIGAAILSLAVFVGIIAIYYPWPVFVGMLAIAIGLWLVNFYERS